MLIICQYCNKPFNFDRYSRPAGCHGGKTPKNCLRRECRSLRDHLYYIKWRDSHNYTRYQLKKEML